MGVAVGVGVDVGELWREKREEIHEGGSEADGGAAASRKLIPSARFF